MLTIPERIDYQKKIDRVKDSIHNVENCIKTLKCPDKISKFEKFIEKKKVVLQELLTEYRQENKID